MKTSNPKYRKQKERIHILEFNAQQSSIITVHNIFADSHTNDYTCIELCDVMLEDHLYIAVTGFRKIAFMKMDTDNSFYGMGIITDGHYKLCVHIVNYVHTEELTVRGQKVKVKEFMNKSEVAVGASTFKVEGMSDIEICEGELMPMLQLKAAVTSVTTIKRVKNNDDTKNYINK
ncbi:hypothetical protein HCN44_008834 [Aphidius gifuensis]|uniref:Uncharacterized protein n=1 Tax=Aphidius gifuensis TaxID=684658 RepID=A0A834Y2Y7_APHGI|nr:hypothetical protein HCN44_008834 [Aphidius gifuensis]